MKAAAPWRRRIVCNAITGTTVFATVFASIMDERRPLSDASCHVIPPSRRHYSFESRRVGQVVAVVHAGWPSSCPTE